MRQSDVRPWGMLSYGDRALCAVGKSFYVIDIPFKPNTLPLLAVRSIWK